MRTNSTKRKILTIVQIGRVSNHDEGLKFAFLTMKNSSFARFARACFSFGPSTDFLVLSTTWNDLFCSWVGQREHMIKCSILFSYH